MIKPADITRRALRHYFEWLERITKGDEVFQPLVINRTGDDRSTDDVRLSNLDVLAAESKNALGYGYRLELEPPKLRSVNKQSRVQCAMFDTAEDLLRFLEKEDDFAAFNSAISLIRARCPALLPWCVKNVRDITRYSASWPALLAVAQFFQENPRPALPRRLLDIPGIDTKFIESNESILRKLLDAVLPPEQIDVQEKDFDLRYGLTKRDPLIQFWLADKELAKHFQGFTSLAAPMQQLMQHSLPGHTVIVVENLTSAEQLAKQHLPETVVIFGGGFGAALLREATWLHQRRLYYWGDLDAHGFLILCQFRRYFPHTQSLLMDENTWRTFQIRATTGKPVLGYLTENLTPEEQRLFIFLQNGCHRLEQEQIALGYIENVVVAL